MDQTQRIAIVTGANRGIGLGVVQQLAARGFTTFLGARNLEQGREAAEPLMNAGLKVEATQLDVTVPASVEALRSLIEKRYGKLDVLVNNAGALYDSWERVVNADLDTVRQALETNTIGPWRMAMAFIPLLRKSQHPRIVNVSSEVGALASLSGETPAYSISKLALNGLTRMLASDLQAQRILVNSVCPGWVATDMGGSSAPRIIEEGAKSVVWAALLNDDGPSGGFFRDGMPLEM